MIKTNFKDWAKAAGIRAIKTMAQSALSLITVGNMLTEMNWISILSISATAGIVSVLTSITGLPELKDKTISE